MTVSPLLRMIELDGVRTIIEREKRMDDVLEFDGFQIVKCGNHIYFRDVDFILLSPEEIKNVIQKLQEIIKDAS